MKGLSRIGSLLRLRPWAYGLGLALGTGCLLGAHALTNGHGHEQASKSDAPAVSSEKSTGPIVLGTVDSDPMPVAYMLPPVIQSGVIAEVFVKEGDDVHAGDKLYSFDTSVQQSDLELSRVAVDLAKAKLDEAKEAKEQHDVKVKNSELMVTVAQRNKELKGDLYNLIKSNLQTAYEVGGVPKTDWDNKLRNDDKLFAAHVGYIAAMSEWEQKQRELKTLMEAEKIVVALIKQADIGVKQAESMVAKAQTALDLCLVRAKSGGTVEQVTISPGTTLGISTRTPALWLIPAGPRIVRAEIEADFAYRITPHLKGKEVVIYDNTDPKLTYRGKVRRIGGTFLPKRTDTGSLLGNETRVLEAVIEVTDSTPKDKPPLRVGQRVRVDLSN
jgi:multidrug efflux pump subunit AcrA (membrane-fusion protein)